MPGAGNWLVSTSAVDSPYWRNLNVRRGWKLLVAAFLTFSSLGFLMDLMAIGLLPRWEAFFFAVFQGLMAVVYLLLTIRRPKLIVVAVMFQVLVSVTLVPLTAVQHRLDESLRMRILVDAGIIIAVLVAGYQFFLRYIGDEGLQNVRLQTELAFAHAIQKTLVPPLAVVTPSLEVFGKSIPSEMVGGDLIDFVGRDGGGLAYIADVSGHGIPAGVLMGMLKTAVRTALDSGCGMRDLLLCLNRVLPGVKEPNMYATMACIRFDGSHRAEFAIAGHLPILVLHYSSEAAQLERLDVSGFPVGLLAKADWNCASVEYGDGDLFALVTDGIVETTNDADEEYGLEPVERLLAKYSSAPLEKIFDALIADVSRHGPAADDRTVLLVRAR